jgi:hypothetical protein
LQVKKVGIAHPTYSYRNKTGEKLIAPASTLLFVIPIRKKDFL